MKLGPRQKKWIKALRSGKYEQGEGALRDSYDKFCCLGVACDIYDDSRWGIPRVKTKSGYFEYFYRYGKKGRESEVATKEVREYLGLRDGYGSRVDDPYGSLIEMNDEGKSFKRIANALEKNPERYFKESK